MGPKEQRLVSSIDPRAWFLLTWKAILGYPKVSYFVAYLLLNE